MVAVLVIWSVANRYLDRDPTAKGQDSGPVEVQETEAA